AARGRRAAARVRRATRARAAGVGAYRRRGGLRRHLHFTLGDRGCPRRGNARRGARPGAPAGARHLPPPGVRAHAPARRAGVPRPRTRTARMIVRWGLGALPEVLRGRAAFLLATRRWDAPVDVVGRWTELPTDAVIDPGEADVLLALGGGSTIDTAKRVSAETDLPLVSVPTTYSGSEWPAYYAIPDPAPPIPPPR